MKIKKASIVKRLTRDIYYEILDDKNENLFSLNKKFEIVDKNKDNMKNYVINVPKESEFNVEEVLFFDNKLVIKNRLNNKEFNLIFSLKDNNIKSSFDLIPEGIKFIKQDLSLNYIDFNDITAQIKGYAGVIDSPDLSKINISFNNDKAIISLSSSSNNTKKELLIDSNIFKLKIYNEYEEIEETFQNLELILKNTISDISGLFIKREENFKERTASVEVYSDKNVENYLYKDNILIELKKKKINEDNSISEVNEIYKDGVLDIKIIKEINKNETKEVKYNSEGVIIEEIIQQKNDESIKLSSNSGSIKIKRIKR